MDSSTVFHRLPLYAHSWPPNRAKLQQLTNCNRAGRRKGGPVRATRCTVTGRLPEFIVNTCGRSYDSVITLELRERENHRKTHAYVYSHKRATWPWSPLAVTAHKYPLLSSGYIPNASPSHSAL